MRYEIGQASIIGTREEQQDAMMCIQGSNSFIAAVCDGMGGMRNGQQASMTAIARLRELFEQKPSDLPFPEFFLQSVDMLDESVCALGRHYEREHMTGTTIVAAAIEQDSLYWLSVGDSRLYVVRGQEIMSVTTDHNYFLQLDAMLRNGDITKERYQEESSKGGALISFLGVRGIKHMDINQRPLRLVENDVLILVSDGLYRCVTEKEMLEIVMGVYSAQGITDRLVERSIQNSREKKQDNTTIITIKMMGDNVL